MTSEAARHRGTRGLARAVAVSLTAVLAVGAVAVYGYLVVAAIEGDSLGIDLRFVLVLGERWMETGTMYLPYQLAGPYDVDPTSIDQVPGLYPPAAGPLFAALTFIPLPLLTVAWFIVPIWIAVTSLRAWRPAAWSWPILVALVGWPTSAVIIVCGGTTMLAAALVALALRGVRWPVALLLLKPTLAPFALLGVRSRAWWALAGGIVVATLLGPWRDYLTAVSNAQGLEYAAWSLPIMLAPVLAWLARTAGGGVAQASELSDCAPLPHAPPPTG